MDARRQRAGDRRTVFLDSLPWCLVVAIASCVTAATLPSDLSADESIFGWGSPSAAGSNEAKLDMPGPERFEPVFGFEAGVLFLQRSSDAGQTIAYSDGTQGPQQPIVTSAVLDPDSIAASRLRVCLFNLTKHVPGLDMDGTFISADDRTGEVTISATNYPTTNVVPFFFGGIPRSPVDTYTLTVDSDFNTGDWTIGYRPVPRLRLLAGLRWLRLKEDYDIVQGGSGGGGTVTGFFTKSVNEAFGVEIGTEATLWSNGVVRLFGRGKYAWLENSVDGDAIAANYQITFEDKIDTNLLDLEFGATIRAARWLLFQVSYQGLFLDDLASVLGQADALDLTGTNDQQPVYTDVDWSGVHFGATFVW
jgi:hypothetical protein